ncbi:unnamed protein product [Urochloa humidicola]
MAAVASNREVSATIILALLVTGWCMAMASAAPVANGRRLQKSAASGDLRRPLLTPTARLERFIDEMLLLLESEPAGDVLRQLQEASTRFLQALRGQPASVWNRPESQRLVQLLRNHVVTKLQVVSTQIVEPRAVTGCAIMVRVNVSGAISDLRSQLKPTTNELPISMQPIALMIDLLDLEEAVMHVPPCAPGLRAILGNGQGILTTLRELLANMQ